MHPQGPSFSGFYNPNIAASWGEITDGTRADVSIKPDKVWRHYWKLLHSIGQSRSVEQRRLFSFIFILRGKKKCVCVRARACVMAPRRALTFQSSDNAVAKCSHFVDSPGGGEHTCRQAFCPQTPHALHSQCKVDATPQTEPLHSARWDSLKERIWLNPALAFTTAVLTAAGFAFKCQLSSITRGHIHLGGGRKAITGQTGVKDSRVFIVSAQGTASGFQYKWKTLEK